jgi:hypothetical protein
MKKYVCAPRGPGNPTQQEKQTRVDICCSCIILTIHAPWLCPNMLFDDMKNALCGERLSSQETHQAPVHERYHNTLKEYSVKPSGKLKKTIWWWNDVLRTHYTTINCAILHLLICRNSSPGPNHFQKPLIHKVLRLLIATFVVMRSPFNLDKQKVISLIYLHLSTSSYSRQSTSSSPPDYFVWCSHLQLTLHK